MNKNEDPLLIFQLRKGNHAAFNQLYSKYFSKVFGFTLRITGSKPDAEEIVQEVFVKIWEIRESLDPQKCFSNLLFTIGKHKIYNKARQRAYEHACQNYFTHYRYKNVDLTDQEITFHETKALIEKAINFLPEKRKEVFVMSKIEGLSNKEIANRLNTSLSNIENHINKALKCIKYHMEKNEILIWLILAGIYL